MMTLCVRLFGRFSAWHEGQPLDGLDSAKAQELFSYLLLNRGRRFPRETLGNLLWPDGTPAQCRKYLRQALWHVQSALEPLTSSGAALICADADWLRLGSPAPLDLDVETFERAYQSVKETPGAALDAQAAALVASAVQLYEGDLLEGWYQDWCLYERERLQVIHLALLDRLMGYSEAQRQYDAGIAYAITALRHDPAHERTHRRLMRLYYLAGDRTAALRQYERCRTALREELGIDPGRRTLALHDQIAADQLPAALLPRAADRGSAAVDTAVQLSGLHTRLTRLQQALTALRDQVVEDVRSVEIALRGDGR